MKILIVLFLSLLSLNSFAAQGTCAQVSHACTNAGGNTYCWTGGGKYYIVDRGPPESWGPAMSCNNAEGCTSDQTIGETGECVDPPVDECAESTNYEQCTCEADGKYYNSFSDPQCQELAQCEAPETRDTTFNVCVDSDGCESGTSKDQITGDCIPDPDPQPEPDPEPTPDPDPTPDLDSDNDGIPDSQETDDDNDGLDDNSDDDVDGDGIKNSEDKDFRRTTEINSESNQRETVAELKKVNQKLDTNNFKTETTNQLLSKGIGKTNSHLKELNEHLKKPVSTFDDRTSGTPTIEETNTRIKALIFDNAFINSVMTIPTINSSNSCPVFTVPATQYWTGLTLDVHCVVFSDNRATLSGLFLGIWALIAAVTFLRA